jgi:DNA-binding FadR family transcriptional regulator
MSDTISRALIANTEKPRIRYSGRRYHGAVAHALGRSILAGDFAPGDILSSKADFTKALDISHGAYREAIQVLTAKGLVESRPKMGTRVLPRDRWNLLDPDVLAWAFDKRPDRQLLRSLFELQAIVEPAAAAFAAARRVSGDLEALQDALLRMRSKELSCETKRTANRDFHASIFIASRNHALVALSPGIAAAVEWTTQLKQGSQMLMRDSVPEHYVVYEAIRIGDRAAAADAMRSLLELALGDINSDCYE